MALPVAHIPGIMLLCYPYASLRSLPVYQRTRSAHYLASCRDRLRARRLSPLLRLAHADERGAIRRDPFRHAEEMVRGL